MNILSLFDGMSCGQIALNRIGIKPSKYYAAEIDKYAIKVTQANYPDTIQLGNVTDWRDWDIEWGSIDLVSGGFPCQAWSMAGKQLGDKDERGMLFWVMLDIIKHVKQHNPKIKFLIENVKMKKEFEEYITHHTEQALGEVNKVLINSALVSAQNRNRYYWTNWHVEQPEDKGVVLADIIEDGFVDRNNAHCIDANYYKGGNLKSYFEKHRRQLVFDTPHRIATASDIKVQDYNKRVCSTQGKSPTLAASSGGNLEPKILTVELNDRIKGFTENERGIRPHKGDKAKSGISELGRILKISAAKTDTLTTSHMPKILCGAIRGGYLEDGKTTEQKLELRKDEKTNSLTTVQKDNQVVSKESYRKLTPIECERLQTVPDNYTNHVSNTQRYKMLGNGWTVDVIAHVLKQADLSK